MPRHARLRKNPVFLYLEDGFQKPNPFEPSVVVPIDSTIDKKLACVDALESQFYEWNPWLFGYLEDVPKDRTARFEWLKGRYGARFASTADRFRDKLVEELGPEKERLSSTPRRSSYASMGHSPRKTS